MIHTGNNEILCPKCMTLQSAGNSSAYCEHCGSPLDIENKPYQLRPGTVLANRYIIGSVLGAGGFGITYTGWDSRLSARIAIKEYFPVGFVDRRADDGSDLTVTAGNEAAVFEKQKRRFIEEARILAKFLNDPAIVSVIDVITENNTAYTVMHLISGMNLAEYIKTYGNLTFDQAYGALRRVMLTLGRVHAAGLIHRDLSPSNIMVQEDGSLILLDFGSAREYDDENDKSMSVILKPGYAPSEQYISHGAQGPWTDVYSVCATLYKMITGVTPENSLTRMGADTLKSPSELGAVISPSQEAALLKGLNVTRGGRYSSMVELIAALDGSADAGCPDTGNVNGGYVHTENLYAGKQDPGYTDTDAGSTQMIFASSKPVVQTHTTAKVEAPKETAENVSVYGNDEETEYLFGAPMAAAVSDQSEAGQAVSAPPVKSEPVITPQPERQPAAASQPVSPSVSSTKPASAAILEKKKKKTGLIIAAVVLVAGVLLAVGVFVVRNSKKEYYYNAESGYFILGKYEQDGDTSNGPEPIEWVVFKDKENSNRLLLVSRYVLDYKPFDDDICENWGYCSLRKWLNKNFYDTAFSFRDKRIIKETTLQTREHYTKDYVFCLSIDELVKYFDSEQSSHSQKLMAESTQYAISGGNRVDSIGFDDFDTLLDSWGYDRTCVGRSYSRYLLRTYTDTPGKVCYVNTFGEYGYSQEATSNAAMGIRPALYIEL